MGGIAIVAGVVLGYAVAHLRNHEALKFARTGLTLLVLIVGLAVVGFIDDYLAIRRGRNMGLRKRGKAAGELLVGERLRAARRPLDPRVDPALVHASDRRRPRHDGLDPLRDRRRVRERERRQPHRWPRRSRRRRGDADLRRVHGDLLLAVPSPWPVRHRAGHRAGVGDRSRGHRGSDDRRVRWVPVLECRAGAHLHGRHRFTRHRWRHGRARRCCRT